MHHSFTYNCVPRSNIGPESLAVLPEVCVRLALRNPLVVTDQGLVAAGLLVRLQECLEASNIAHQTYDQVLADPPERNVFDAVSLAQHYSCDSVIGFGGGSSMDVAKLVAALLASEQPLVEMYGVEMISGGRLPLIQIPTTAGTGSEATAVAIITTGESSKAGVVSPVLFADHIILDAELTLGLPAQVTAATGVDAMVHAIEAFTSVRLKNPMSDAVALQALRLLSANIETVVREGSNLHARADMLLGAMLAGQAFANAPVAAVHALAYPLGGTFHITHGLSNSLMLPHVLRFNAPQCGDLYLQLATAIEGVNAGDFSAATIGEAMADYCFQLAERLGLKTRLRDMDIVSDDLPNLAHQAMDQQRLLINNPREVTYDDALMLYQQAF